MISYLLAPFAAAALLLSNPPHFETSNDKLTSPKWFMLPKDDAACMNAFNELKQDFIEQQKVLMGLREEILRTCIMRYEKKGLLDFSIPWVAFSRETIGRNNLARFKKLDWFNVSVYKDHLTVSYDLNAVQHLDRTASSEKKHAILCEPYGAFLLPLNIALSEARLRATPFTPIKKVTLGHDGVVKLCYWFYRGGCHAFTCDATVPLTSVQQNALKILYKKSKEAALKYLDNNKENLII